MANLATISFNTSHGGVLTSEHGSSAISVIGKSLMPYELLNGAYASCLHATLLGILKKRRLTFDTVTYDVYSTKREEIPTLLNYVKTTITITGVEEKNQPKFIKSLEQAEKYCSISAMIGAIAEMEYVYLFK